MRATRPRAVRVLVYDDGCGLCCAAAAFLRRRARVPLRLIGFSEVRATGLFAELSDRELRSAAHLVTPEGRAFHGGAAVTRALRCVRFGAVFALFDLPGLRLLRDAVYELVSRNRGRIRLFGAGCTTVVAGENEGRS